MHERRQIGRKYYTRMHTNKIVLSTHTHASTVACARKHSTECEMWCDEMNWVNRMSWLRFPLGPHLCHGKTYSFTCDTDSKQYETTYVISIVCVATLCEWKIGRSSDFVSANWHYTVNQNSKTKFYHFFYLNWTKDWNETNQWKKNKTIRPFYGHLIVAFAFISINLLIHMKWTVFNFSEWIFHTRTKRRRKKNATKMLTTKLALYYRIEAGR